MTPLACARGWMLRSVESDCRRHHFSFILKIAQRCKKVSPTGNHSQGSMSDTPETRASLLVRIRDPRDGEAWRTFLAPV